MTEAEKKAYNKAWSAKKYRENATFRKLVAKRGKLWRKKNRRRANEHARRWCEKFPDKAREVGRKNQARRRREQPDAVRTINSKWRQMHPDQVRASKRKAAYGLTAEAYAQMHKAQKGLCAICRYKKATQVDHDHGTGVVRQLLCAGCNLGIGHLRDDPRICIRAAAYLRRHKKREK